MLEAEQVFGLREKQRGLKELLSYLWYQTDVNVAEVLPLHFELELPEGLDERHTLDVSDSSSQLRTRRESQNIESDNHGSLCLSRALTQRVTLHKI